MIKDRINRLYLKSVWLFLLLPFLSCGDKEPDSPSERAKEFNPAQTIKAEKKEITDWYEAIGTVRPRTETNIEATVTAQVMDIKVNPGSHVSKGDLLISLDSRQLKSKMDQAKQAYKSAISQKEQARQTLTAAQAAFQQAESDFNRIKKYFESQAATAQEKERAESSYLQAKAEVKRAYEGLSASESRIEQAEEVIKESEIGVSYTQIKAPEDGVVLKRYVDPGDLALPGKPLISLRTTGAFRLEAYVREGMISKIDYQNVFNVVIDTLNLTIKGTVEEIVPYADPYSRTFLVKTALPQIKDIYPGMFGKLLIPVSQETAVLIPKKYVRKVGQLELVDAKIGEKWRSLFIKTGRDMGNDVEVLAGLTGDETLGWEGR